MSSRAHLDEAWADRRCAGVSWKPRAPHRRRLQLLLLPGCEALLLLLLLLLLQELLRLPQAGPCSCQLLLQRACQAQAVLQEPCSKSCLEFCPGQFATAGTCTSLVLTQAGRRSCDSFFTGQQCLV